MSEPFDVPDLIARLRRANTMTLAFEQKEASGCNKYTRYARRKDGKASWVSPFKDVFGDGNLSFITKTGKRGTNKDAIHKKEESRFEHIIRPDRDRMIVDCDRTVFNVCDELMLNINSDCDVSQLTMLEVRDKYVSNVMPRLVLLVCPDTSDPENTCEEVIGIKDDGTVFNALCQEISLTYEGPKFKPIRGPHELGQSDEAKETMDARKTLVNEILANVWGKDMWMHALDSQFAQVSGVLQHYIDHDGIFRTETKKTIELMEAFKHRSLYTDMDRTTTNPMKVWSVWSDKKVYKKALYDPSRPVRDYGGDVFNLFTGWGVDPTAPKDPNNPCPHIMQHGLEVMSSGNKVHWRFWLDALATWFRNPATKLECAFVMKCLKGAGKGAWWKVIKMMWGIHSVEIVDQTHLTGRFNSHLQGKSAVALNEACWGGSYAANSKLLSIVSDPDYLHEGKYGTPSMMLNYWVVFIMANADWCVPATIDNRRFFIPTISESRIGDKEYFNAYFASLPVEVPEFLYYLLHTHKITPDFRAGSAIQAMGNTDVGVEQILGGNAAFLTKWVKHGLEAGELRVGHDPTYKSDDNDSVDYSNVFLLFNMKEPTLVSSDEVRARFEKEVERNTKLRKTESQYLVPRSINKNMVTSPNNMAVRPER